MADEEILHKAWKKFKRELDEDEEFCAERAAFKDPGSIRVAYCDDSYFTGSELVFVDHKDESRYMGTSVVFIPQTGDSNEFFLYPGHFQSLLRVLYEVQGEQNKYPKSKPLMDPPLVVRTHKVVRRYSVHPLAGIKHLFRRVKKFCT